LTSFYPARPSERQRDPFGLLRAGMAR
jgi:hypothetical protein